MPESKAILNPSIANICCEPFLRSGTQHMFAIDGLRIALLSGMIVALWVCCAFRAWCGAIAIPVIWFYTAATGWEASAMRASVMMTIVLVGWMLKLPGHLLNSLAGAALVILWPIRANYSKPVFSSHSWSCWSSRSCSRPGTISFTAS